jgi:hypothetical protein
LYGLRRLSAIAHLIGIEKRKSKGSTSKDTLFIEQWDDKPFGIRISSAERCGTATPRRDTFRATVSKDQAIKRVE